MATQTTYQTRGHTEVGMCGRAGVQAVRRTEGTDGRAGTKTDGQTHRHVA